MTLFNNVQGVNNITGVSAVAAVIKYFQPVNICTWCGTDFMARGQVKFHCSMGTVPKIVCVGS